MCFKRRLFLLFLYSQSGQEIQTPLCFFMLSTLCLHTSHTMVPLVSWSSLCRAFMCAFRYTSILPQIGHSSFSSIFPTPWMFFLCLFRPKVVLNPLSQLSTLHRLSFNCNNAFSVSEAGASLIYTRNKPNILDI